MTKQSEETMNKDTVLSLSPTSIQLYLGNPMAFYRKKILGEQGEANVHQVLGTVIHQTIAYMYEKNITDIKKLITYYKRTMTIEAREIKDIDERAELDTLAEHVGRMMISTYFQNYGKREIKPFAIEEKISYEVDGIEIKNIVDAVYRYEDEVFGDEYLEIEDYKTVKSPYKDGQVLTSLQLRSYAVACEEKWKIPVKRAKFICITKTGNPKIYEQSLNFDTLPEENWKKAFLMDLKKVIKAIKSEYFYRKYDDYLFEWSDTREGDWGAKNAGEYIITKEIQ